MATKINFYLNETKTRHPPKNWKEFGIELNFDKDTSKFTAQITITDFEFVKDNSDIIQKWLSDGLTSGVGVFEGIPFRIEVVRNGIVEVPFRGYLDLTQNGKLSSNRSTVRAVSQDGIDSLNDRVDSFTFRHLYNIGQIRAIDFTFVPYILNSVPNYVEATVASIGVYMMAKEIKDAIQRILEFVAELPVYYVFSTYIKLILYIIFLIFLIIALIKLVKQVILLLIQPVKYHACMSVKTQLERGAEFLGMKFSSPIFDEEPFKNSYIIPEKYFNPPNKKEKQIFGFTEPSVIQEGFYKGTFGDLLRECKKIWNARIVVLNNTIYLLRDDKTPNPQWTMPKPNNGIYQPHFELNTDEFNANTFITFAVDGIDKNTMQDYKGTSYEVTLEPLRVNNTHMILMKGLDEVRIDFALAKTKTELTLPEQIMEVFLKVFDVIAGVLITVVNAIITVLNAIIALVNDILQKLATIGIKLNFQLPSIPTIDPPDFVKKAKNRIGMLKIEKDIIGINKICLLNVAQDPLYTKIHDQNDFFFSGNYLYNNYHFVKSFLPNAEKPNANQWIKKTFEKVPFTFDDYEKVKGNNAIFTAYGSEALVDSLKWNIWEQYADISIRENKLYTNNFKASFVEPDGK